MPAKPCDGLGRMLGRGLAIAFTLVVAVCAWWQLAGDSRQAYAQGPPSQEEVPVKVAAAHVQDVPVYLDGLGTVQALNMVVVKAQVTGTLIALPAAEGQEVHKGDIVAEIDPRPYKAALDQVMAQRDEDTAVLRSARLNLVRYQNLAKQHFAPTQQVDDQQATVDKQVAAVALDDAAIETARINLGYCVIRAPMDGRVGFYQLNVGNLVAVASQTGILSITQDKPIAMVFTLPEAELARVMAARARGMVPVQVSEGQNSAIVASGSLLTPNNTIDTATGTISLKAVFDNTDNRLWPGEFVNARILVDTLHSAVTIPTLAVQHGPDGLFVFKMKPDNTVAQSGVEVGYQDNGLSVITAGVLANDTVVVSGQSRLAPGVRVRASEASKAADGKAPASAGSSS